MGDVQHFSHDFWKANVLSLKALCHMTKVCSRCWGLWHIFILHSSCFQWIIILTFSLSLNFNTQHSLHPKGIIMPPEFFGPKMIVQFICPPRNLRFKIKYFCTKVIISRSLLIPQLPGGFQFFSKLRVILSTTRQWLGGLYLAKIGT